MKAIVRLLLAFCWVTITFSYRIIGLILAPVAPRANHYFRRSAFRLCAKGILKITGVRLTVHGTPPDPPFFLVSNHITFIDVFVLASQLGCVFVSKSELGNWPVLSFITRNMNTILINREDLRDTHRVNDQIKEAMEQEMGIVVFVEGTVTETGELLPFKPALLQPAVELNMPVHYASIQYETPQAYRLAWEHQKQVQQSKDKLSLTMAP